MAEYRNDQTTEPASRPATASNNSMIYFILGGVVIALAVGWFVMTGGKMDGVATTPSAPTPSISIENNAAPAPEAAPAPAEPTPAPEAAPAAPAPATSNP